MDSDDKKYTPTEKEALIQLRKRLSDVLSPDVSDNVLLKWLRVKNFNLKKSEELYRENLRYRQMFRIPDLETIWRQPEVIDKYEFANYLGIAKDGTPIRYIAMGRGDLKGFYLSLDIYDIGKYCVREIESDMKKCKEQSKKLGRDINEMTYIVDMDGFNISQVWFSGVLEMGLDLIRLLQDHFPEIWENILIVNAPFYFHTVFNFFKPILRPVILEKIRVVSRGQSPSLLLKYIDADVLPQFLGGTRVDSKGDPRCSEFMKFGGTVPEKYYLRNRSPLLPTDPGVEDYWVPPKGCLNMLAVVREPNSSIHVEFRSEGGSLPAALYYRKFESDPDKYIDLPGKDEHLDPRNKNHNIVQCGPFLHLHTHVAPIDNYAYAAWPGIYVFRVDNSYNWLSGRRCIYRIRVEPPEKKQTAESQPQKAISNI